jgi:glycine betaine/proline transport system substrate-binding protein
MKTRYKSFIIAAIVGAMAFVGCQKQSQTTATDSVATDEKVANLVYVNWAEGVAYTHLAQAVLEEKMGYEVNLTMADVGPGYMAVANGTQDAFMECWPAMHEDYLNEGGERLIDLGVVYEGTVLGLVVPAYVTIDKISELNDHADKFKGVITGIDSGAGMMRKIKDTIIPDYNLELELVPSSGPAMTAALGAAIEAGEWIVVPGWKPHWMFGRWELKVLEQDADKIVWNEGDIHIQARHTIGEDKPTLKQFLENMYLTDAQLSDLMVKVEDSDLEVAEVARDWMLENEEVVEAWIP